MAEGVSWVAGGPSPAGPFEGEVRVRYRGDDVPAVVDPSAGGTEAKVEFRRPERAIAPGQSAVFYQGDELLGGGRIRESF